MSRFRFVRVTRQRAAQLLADAKEKKWPVTVPRLELLAFHRYSGCGVPYSAIECAVHTAYAIKYGRPLEIKQKPLSRDKIKALIVEMITEDPDMSSPAIFAALEEVGPLNNAPAAFGPFVSTIRAELGIKLAPGRRKQAAA